MYYFMCSNTNYFVLSSVDGLYKISFHVLKNLLHLHTHTLTWTPAKTITQPSRENAIIHDLFAYSSIIDYYIGHTCASMCDKLDRFGTRSLRVIMHDKMFADYQVSNYKNI